MTQGNGSNDGGRKPSYRDHPLYYPIIKAVVVLCGVYFLLRLAGVL